MEHLNKIKLIDYLYKLSYYWPQQLARREWKIELILLS